MKEFTLSGFAAHLQSLASGTPVLEAEMLEHIGTTVENAAKEKIGEYQEEAGPFSAWSPLAESTKEDRVRQGYPEDEPGLRSGEMRDSIGHRVQPPEVRIGSDDDKLLWFELGTVKQPPRSVLGGAAFEQTPKLLGELGPWFQGYLAGTKGVK